MLITAGPTHEPVDAVRYIANRSSGRLGLAMADAATRRGLSTTLLLGPTLLEPPRHSRLTTVRFQTADDLRRLLVEHWPKHRVLVMAAAVADYRPAAPLAGKRSRGAGAWTLELEPTPDLLAEAAAAARDDQITVGFTVEAADRLAGTARHKLAAKHVDAIVANPLETIGSETIDAELLLRDGRALRPPERTCTKAAFAEWLLDQIQALPSDR